MDGEKCIICDKLMRQSVNKIDGWNVHAKCVPLYKEQQEKKLISEIESKKKETLGDKVKRWFQHV